MISDATTAMQVAVSGHLKAVSAGGVQLDGVISSSVLWRPHVYQIRERVGWQLHSKRPDTDSWEKRIVRACAVDNKLRVGVAATHDALMEPTFLLACQNLQSRIIVLKEARDSFLIDESYASVPDFICERGIKLDGSIAKRMLDVALERALSAKTKAEKGVTLEIVVALLLSQVDNFEVADTGIANRTQQMDVLVHNRGVGGVLGLSPLVLAEAKNWREKVTPSEYAAFLRKLATRNGRAKLGFLVTTGEFTAGVALEARRDSTDDIVVVCINGVALPKIWRGPKPITHQIERLVIDATVGS